jgi:hypothetical protein
MHVFSQKMKRTKTIAADDSLREAHESIKH